MRAPERRQASTGAGEQLTLIDPPPFCPTCPSRKSALSRVEYACGGQDIDHGDLSRALIHGGSPPLFTTPQAGLAC